MRIADLLLPEFDQEIATTRRVLERVPDERGEWRPHPKSFPLGHLAQLVARMPGWATMVMERTELDIAPVGGGFPGYSFEKTATLLEEFDRNATAGRAAIEAAREEDWQVPWTFKRAGETLYVVSRYHMLRTSVLNHLVHHRAQLGVYLRLLDVPVPSMYGPTADERM
ncbi:MAG: damage-inducible protein DinB [Gemmatimonadetes bacterium]|nr:damage-inducible protein DinB [Gemmatimonadota bacterium]